MRAIVLSENPAASYPLRQQLLHEGIQCLAEDMLSLELAADQLVGAAPDLVVVVLSINPELALDKLAELRLLTQSRILAVGPASDPRLVLRALRSGADDFLDENELGVELPAALARLQTELTVQAEPARIITVLAPSGGSGSSTVAVNTATVLAKEHKSALLFDLKVETGDLASLLNLKPVHTLADLCRNAARMDRTMFERALVQHKSGVRLLAPSRALTDIGHVTAEGVRQALTLARSLFPYIIVDLEHSFREEQLQVLRMADVILLVMRLDFTSLQNTHRTLDYLVGNLGIDSSRLRLVVNRYGQPREVPAAKAEQALGVKIFHYVPDDPKTVNSANNNGVPAVLEFPRARMSRSIVKLAAGIDGRPHAS